MDRFKVENRADLRTIMVRMSGNLSTAEVRAGADEYKRATDSYGGEDHLVLADMRDLAPVSPEASELLGEAISYARRRGVVCCAHLTNSSIVELQAARLARRVSPDDEVTVQVASLDEAQRVLAEARAGMSKPRKRARQA